MRFNWGSDARKNVMTSAKSGNDTEKGTEKEKRGEGRGWRGSRRGGWGTKRSWAGGCEKPTDCYPSREAAMKLKELTTML